MRKWLTPERETLIVELYGRYENARETAADMGCSTETVYRALKKHDVKRTHRHDDGAKQKSKPNTKPSHCRSKYCPALIAMLHRHFGWSANEIAEATGYKPQGVRSVLTRRSLTEERKPLKSTLDLDRIEHEYVDLGMTSFALGEKYGVDPRNISRWMRERGIRLGKGNHQRPENHFQPPAAALNTDGLRRTNEQRHEESECKFAMLVVEKTEGEFEYVSDYRRGMARLRHRECGHEFVHSTDLSKNVLCPACKERERERRESECCQYASGYDARGYYRHKYGDMYLEHYDPSVTLKSLYERDSGVCQICGEPCDWDDRAWGSSGPNYPSIDHIVPKSRGGDHFWSNVQLAHCMCNSCKGTKDDEVAKREAVCV